MCGLALPGHGLRVQFFCPACSTWKAARYKHGSKCNHCHHQQLRHPPDAAAAAPFPSTPSPPPPLFDRDEHSHSHLSRDQRVAIAVLHREGHDESYIAQRIPCDEKLFWGEGFWGQVFVRRPKGEALNPDYCVDQRPHPVKVSAWACFSGHGLGYMYIFNENMDAKKLQHILGTHLVESAALHFDVEHAEQWWFLQDNAPQHKSVLVRAWLFNNGIQCIDFPPYSPDLNPIENLWADLARRVEKFQCETMEELQDRVAEQWKKTPRTLLRTLARSMPERCQAVIEAKGDHTKYCSHRQKSLVLGQSRPSRFPPAIVSHT